MIPYTRPGPWVDRGACVGADPELFYIYGSTSHSRDRARAICATCPVRLECLEHAIHHEQFGVWGGLSSEEREQIRRDRGMTYYRVVKVDVTDVWA